LINDKKNSLVRVYVFYQKFAYEVNLQTRNVGILGYGKKMDKYKITELNQVYFGLMGNSNQDQN